MSASQWPEPTYSELLFVSFNCPAGEVRSAVAGWGDPMVGRQDTPTSVKRALALLALGSSDRDAVDAVLRPNRPAG